MVPTVWFTTPKVPADAALKGCPGCTRLAAVGLSPAPGSALGSVAGGLAKLVWLKRLKTSRRSSAFVPRLPKPNRFATTRSICWKPGPLIELRSRLPNVPGFGVAKAAGFRKMRPPSSMNGIDAGDQVRPPRGARGAAAGRVDHGRAVRRRVVPDEPAAVDVDDVIARDEHRNRQAAARVGDAADRPSALSAPFARNRVERAQVERVPDVEVVVAVVVVEVGKRAARCCRPSPLRSSRRCCPCCSPACTGRSWPRRATSAA